MEYDAAIMNEDVFLDISGMLAVRARERPEAPALIFEGRAIPWRDFHCRLNRFAHALIRLGIEPGDRVGILAGVSPEHVVAFLGALRAGACAVPLPSGATPEDLERMVEDSNPGVLVVSSPLDEAVACFADPRGRLLIALDFEGDGWAPLDALLSDAPETSPGIERTPLDDFSIMYSSGTTQAPRGILHSHRMRSFQIHRMGRLGFDAETVTLIATPLYSNTTLITLLPTLAFGGTVVLMSGFEARRFLETAERHRVTHTMLVPIQVQRILGNPDFEAWDLSSFVLKLATGAPLSAAMKRELLTRWPGNFIEIYGQTEGGCTALLDAAAHPDKLDSVGRPAPGVDVRLLGEDGREVPRGEVGEIAGRAVSMMTGYHGRPDLTEEITWHDAEGNVHYRTGDLGFLDEDGFLHLRGRRKDVIISGGFNIHASDLEAVLVEHPAVVDAAVIGVPSERWGETPMGFIVLEEDFDLSAEDVLHWANARLGKTQRLSGLELRDELPRNAAGKVMKRDLGRIASEGPPPPSH